MSSNISKAVCTFMMNPWTSNGHLLFNLNAIQPILTAFLKESSLIYAFF